MQVAAGLCAEAFTVASLDRGLKKVAHELLPLLSDVACAASAAVAAAQIACWGHKRVFRSVNSFEAGAR